MMESEDLKERLYTRFARYAAIHTTSDSQSDTVPSTAGQLNLARLLADELAALSITDLYLDPRGYIYAGLPATPGCENVPPIGFIAHLDTSPEVSGDGVVPQRHPPYAGGDIVISSDPPVTLSPTTTPELAEHLGHEIVTASGKTLLGADNKAGVAIIMTLVETLLRRALPHGPVRIAFTVDEEVGRGMDHFDTERFAATYAFTIDGDVLGGLEVECFNADSVTITVQGRSIHPGTAKNRLANAARIAAEIVAAWPAHLLPEHTEKREGFVLLGDIQASIEQATIRGIVRDHDLDRLRSYEALLDAIVATARLRHPLAHIDVEFRQQYRNMRQIIDQHPQLMQSLERAFTRASIPLRLTPIRGGTDGSRLSFMGIPTPNIFTGGANYHARDEWVSLDSMARCVDLLTLLLDEWITPA